MGPKGNSWPAEKKVEFRKEEFVCAECRQCRAEVSKRMMNASRILQQPGSITRPLLITLTFFFLFALLDSASRLFETYPRISLCYLPAGLSLALVLVFGAHYSLLIVVAHLVSELWVHSLPASIGDAVVCSFAVGVAYFGAAALLSRLLGRMHKVQSRPALALFLLGGVLTSICVSLATVLDLWATGLIEWQQISGALTHSTIGCLLGIFSVTPFLILVVAPQLANVIPGIEGGSTAEQLGTNSKGSCRWALVGVAGGFALLGVIIMLVFATQIEDRFVIFCFLLPPFLGIALLAGLEVFAAAAFGAVVSSAAMQWDFQFAFQQTVEFQALLLLVVLNGMLVGTIVSEKKVLQGTDTFKVDILDSVSFAARKLAGVENWENYFTEVLRSFGEASKSVSVCLFEAWPDKSDYKFELFPYEWMSRKYSIDQEQSVILNRLRSRELARRTQHFDFGEVWRDPPSSSTPEERAVWTASGVRFTLIIPIRVEQELWGCLVLGRTEEQRDWSKREIETIRYAVMTFGSLLASARTAEQIRLLSDNIRGDLWISSPDGHRRIGLNPRGENGQSQDQKRLPESWMESVHQEDVSKVESALSSRGDFDLEYRIVMPDRSFRWVRDRGFGVRNEVGQISRIIGMAEDVTDQKGLEQKLEESVDLLAALFDKMGSGILVEDEQLRVRHVNKAFFEILEVEAPQENVAGTGSGELFAQAKVSGRRIERIRNSGIPVVDEQLDLDKTILSFNYVPLFISRRRRYHLWQFRTIQEEPTVGTEEPEESLQAKDALLRKTHQNVKNDLQIIYGVLRLQSNRVRDEVAHNFLAADQTRIMAIALVHERLIKSPQLGSLDFPEYAKNLIDQLIQVYEADSSDVRIRFDLEPLPLGISTAIPCGLIISELVTNSLRYAFPDNRKGEIFIGFGQLDGSNFRLTVRDNGVGFPKGLDFKKTSTLGLMLVTGLTERLGGTVALRNHNGTEFDISFPSNGYSLVQPSVPTSAQTAPSHHAQRVS